MIYYSERMQSKTAKENCSWDEGWGEKPGTIFQGSSPSGNTQTEAQLETQCPEFLLGAGHMGTLCQVHAQIPDSEEKHVFSINHNVGTNSLGIVTYSSVNGENPSEIQVSSCLQGSTL